MLKASEQGRPLAPCTAHPQAWHNSPSRGRLRSHGRAQARPIPSRRGGQGDPRTPPGGRAQAGHWGHPRSAPSPEDGALAAPGDDPSASVPRIAPRQPNPVNQDAAGAERGAPGPGGLCKVVRNTQNLKKRGHAQKWVKKPPAEVQPQQRQSSGCGAKHPRAPKPRGRGKPAALLSPEACHRAVPGAGASDFAKCQGHEPVKSSRDRQPQPFFLMSKLWLFAISQVCVPHINPAEWAHGSHHCHQR